MSKYILNITYRYQFMIIKNIVKIVISVFILFLSFDSYSQGLVGVGFAYNPIAKEKGINFRLGAMNSKSAFTLEYTHFFVEEGNQLFQVGLNLNYGWKISKEFKVRLIGGAFFMKYKSTVFISPLPPFVRESSNNLFGGNIGVGLDAYVTKNIILFGEGKYILHKDVEKNRLFEKTNGTYFFPAVGLIFSF